MLKVGSKFYTFDELSQHLEEFQEIEQVQLWVRDSRTVLAAAKRARRKSLNPALKYAELTYSCVFGGRRPSDQTKAQNQTSAGGCPFKVRLSTSNDGQALVVKEICHDHNHEPGKKLHDEPRRLYKKTGNRTAVRKPVRYIVNKHRLANTKSSSRTKSQDRNSVHQLSSQLHHHTQFHYHPNLQQQQIKVHHPHQTEILQLDSPDHIDTPDHLSSPDLSSTYEHIGSHNNSVDQYTYLPPSPISPSLSSIYQPDSEEEEQFEPILDLEEALEEALGDLDSVGSMEVEEGLRLSSIGASQVSHPSSITSSSSSLDGGATPSTPVRSVCSSPAPPGSATSSSMSTTPLTTKRLRGRARKQSFSGSTFENCVDIPDLDFSLNDLMDFEVYLF